MSLSKTVVSVIIPAYNCEKTIRRACLSVMNQDHPNVELIVVNDGSTDGTAAVLQEMKEACDSLICLSQENGGVSKARNAGISAATGDYLMFLDADDELTEGCLTEMMRLAQTYSCDIVAASCNRIRPDGISYHQPYPMEEDLKIWEGEDAFKLALKDHPATYAVWAKLYRRESIGQTRFVEGRKLHEDSFFLFEVLRGNVKIAATQFAAVNYYLTENSASRSAFSEKFLDMLYFAQCKYEIIEKHYPELLPLGKNILVKANMALLKNMWKSGAEKYRDTERQCQKTVRENSAYFIPAIPVDRIVFLAVRLHLFWAYKILYRMLRR